MTQTMTDRAKKRRLNMITAVATFGALAFGYDTGVISGALPFMVRPMAEGGLDLTPLTEGLVTASLLVGAAVGAFMAGRLNDSYGRRNTIRWLAILFFFGALGTALAPNLTIMVIFRVVLGFAVGGASATIPMFIAEIAPVEQRGPLVSRNELMIVTGQLIAYISNAALAQWGDQAHSWRWMLGLATLPAIALWIGVIFVPESPRWLVMKGRVDEARETLLTVRLTDVEPELNEIQRIVTSSDKSEKKSQHLKIPWIRRIALIGIGFGVVIQLTGVNAIMYFAPTVLISTGLSTNAAITATIANGIISVIATLMGINFLKRMNRRKMLVIGMSGIICSQIALGAAFLLPGSTTRSFIILGIMLPYLAFMQGFCAVVFWLLMSEMFPLRIRGFAMGMAILCQWLANALVTFTFPILLDRIGGNTFFIFAVINVCALIFEYLCIPETRRKSLEELEDELASGGKAREPGTGATAISAH